MLEYCQQGPAYVLNTTEYAITPEKEVKEENQSAQVEVIFSQSFQSKKDWVKIVFFSVKDRDGYSVTIDNKQGCKEEPILTNSVDDKNKWMVVLRGTKDANCRIKIKSADSKGSILSGGITYVYVRK